MKTLYKEILLPISLEKCWDFFSRPENLNIITPPYMNFKILNKVPEKMYKGLMILYKVSPIMNIPMTWVTEITQIEDYKYFVDEQRIGPYKLWHHEHHFIEKENGILAIDKLYYDVGYSIFGKIIEDMFVQHKVNEIFEYREKKLKEIFIKERD
ncbi:MAG TPA: SRPBCC family protein [Ignavibacteriales bacterium]|nr:SRPBCC family protein [Ignavibacteriales bacterium]